MKALVYRGPGQISYENVQDARLRDSRSAVVKTTLCSICGTDLHAYHVDMGIRDYCIGHEAVGQVVEVGADVRNFSVGDRVLIPASVGCGACKTCLSGHVLLCENVNIVRAYGFGIPDLPGSQAEAVSVPAADVNLWRMSDDMPDELGVMLTDGLATAWYCARRGKIAPGDRVAVIGLGPVGQQAVMAALAMGAKQVFAIDLLADRRASAVTLGAEAIDSPAVVEAIAEKTQGRGADVVLDATGGPVTTNLAIEIVKRGGRVSSIGVSETPVIPFPVVDCMMKSVEYYSGVCSAQAEIPTLLDAMAAGRLNAKDIIGLVTHRMKLSEGSQAYHLFHTRPAGLKKIVLDPTA